MASGLALGSWSSNGSYIYEVSLTSLTPKGYELLRDAGKDQKPDHRIVFVSADPTNASRLRLNEEYREISEKIRLSKARDRILLHLALSTRPADLSQALLDLNPTIVHFSGHGTKMGAICVEEQNGSLLPITVEALADLFAPFANSLKLVVLNACFSALQAGAIAKQIECVIGMRKAIGDRAAIAYSIGLYQAIGAGRSIGDAHKLGCAQIRLQGLDEHLTPSILYKNETSAVLESDG
ncbi:MAG TPA: CHAT domain-containing protein [Terriglobales bacterium]|nr:CHAT domain-containing protein [Terriglobales bacterium]